MAKTNYQCIKLAAKAIREKEELYKFGSYYIADPDCGTSACAAGWIMYYKNGPTYLPGIKWLKLGAPKFLKNEEAFYDEMHRISAELTGSRVSWMNSNLACADCLDAYADRYHKPKGKS